MDIIKIKDKEDFITYYKWIKQCNFVESSPDQILLNCLNGTYFGFLAKDKGKVKGMAVCKAVGSMVFIVGCWCKNNVANFNNAFFDKLKAEGFKTARSSSYRDIAAYEKVIGMRKLWTVYERTL